MASVLMKQKKNVTEKGRVDGKGRNIGIRKMRIRKDGIDKEKQKLKLLIHGNVKPTADVK
jgi:hypothetical protein